MLAWLRKCPECEELIVTENLVHCTICGAELDYYFEQGWKCGGCGEEIEDDWVFCGYCGEEIESE